MRRDKILSFFLLFTAFLLAPAVRSAETAVVTEGKINVRGKPSLVGEVITQLQRGDKVTVLERITIEKPKTNEPANWARIKLPENTPAWVFAPFVKDGKVAATRLNLRAGPGENHDVIGRLNRGDEVKAIRTVTEWMEVQAPADAYAFVDSSLLRFEGDTNAPAPAPTIVARPQEQPVVPQPEVATPDTNTVATTQPPPSTETTRPAETPIPEEKPATESPSTNIVVVTEPAPAIEPALRPETDSPRVSPSPAQPLPQVARPLPGRRDEPLPKRVVRREGVIRATKSIQAPTWYELAHADTGKTINYLYEAKLTDKTGLKLKDYRGHTVVVTGEEAIDPRWPNTPILDLESLEVLP